MPVPSSQKTRMGFLVPGVAIPRVVTVGAQTFLWKAEVGFHLVPSAGPAKAKTWSSHQLPLLRARVGGTCWQVCHTAVVRGAH